MEEVICQLCGIVAATARGSEDVSAAILLTWVMNRDSGRVRWTCPECAATNVRAIEAKLDPEWW
ncbi:hypothetical protein ACSMXN_10125 [Jatrophihabitans sp. DSM 45814]